MDKKSSLKYESLCHRCSLKPIELICYECNPSNSFCRNCDATTHSLPSKKNHKRDIVNFIFQNEQQKLQKEIMKMKQKNKASLDIITTPVKENSNSHNNINNNNYYPHSNRDNIELQSDNNENNNFDKKGFSNKSKTIEILEQDRRKFFYGNDYKNCNNNKNSDVNQNAISARAAEEDKYKEYDKYSSNSTNNYKSSRVDFSKSVNEKNNGKESNALFYEGKNNNFDDFSKTMKTGSGYDSYHSSGNYYNYKNSTNYLKKNKVAEGDNYNHNLNNKSNFNPNEDKKMTISCFDYPNTSEINQTNNAYESQKYNQHYNSNNNQFNHNLNTNNNPNHPSNYNTSANGNNAYQTNSSNQNPSLNQNADLLSKNLNPQNFNSNSSNSNAATAAADLKSTNFVTASTSSYYSKEFVNELTTLHNKEKEDFVFKINLMQSSIERIKLSLSEQMQNIQKQLEESNFNYSNKIKNLEMQQKKLSEKNIWLNDQDKQKDKIIEGLKAQMKKLKDSNAELLEKYEYHLDACKNDKLIQQKQFDELQTKIAQKEIEIEELKIYYNKKIEELVYLSSNADGNFNRKARGAPAGLDIGELDGNNHENTLQQSENEQNKIYDNLQDPIDSRIEVSSKPQNYEFSLGNKIDTEKNFNPQTDLNFNVHNSEDFSIKPNESVVPRYYYNDTQDHKNFINNTNNTLNNDYFRQENQINYMNTSKQNEFAADFNEKSELDMKLEMRNLKKMFYAIKDENQMLFENFDIQKKELEKKSENLLDLETRVFSYKQENDLLKDKLKAFQSEYSNYKKNHFNNKYYEVSAQSNSNHVKHKSMNQTQMDYVKSDHKPYMKKDFHENKNNRVFRDNKSALSENERKSVKGTNSFLSYN